MSDVVEKAQLFCYSGWFHGAVFVSVVFGLQQQRWLVIVARQKQQPQFLVCIMIVDMHISCCCVTFPLLRLRVVMSKYFTLSCCEKIYLLCGAMLQC